MAVTGAAGHIGGNLVRSLLAAGRDVRAIVRSDTRALEGLRVELVRADTLDIETLLPAFEGAEAVFHLAARISITGDQGGAVHATNVQGTRNVVEACLRTSVKRLVHFSSIHAFDQRPFDTPLDETRASAGKEHPAYDRSKAAAEREVLSGVERGLSAVIVNPSSVVGPYDFKPSRMGQVVIDLCRRRFPALIPGGFDWVDVRDVAAGAIAAEAKGRIGERYLLSGEWLSVRQLAGLVEEASGARAPALTAPMWLARLAAPFAAAASSLLRKEPLFTPESLHALRSNRQVRRDKAEAELGYRARPIRETVRDTVTWLRETGRLDR